MGRPFAPADQGLELDCRDMLIAGADSAVFAAGHGYPEPLPPGRIEFPAATDAPSLAQLRTWRHGYRIGISQAAELLKRSGDRAETPAAQLEDAIRTLRGWLADARAPR